MTANVPIDYEALAQNAMRGVVRQVLIQVAKNGLPGEHHFYIAFNTQAPGVGISKRLKEKYPKEMTIVLQHRFWDLAVQEDQFEVKLTFDAIPERLQVPFSAVKVFFDPSVPYGLQFEESELSGGGGRRTGASDVAVGSSPFDGSAGGASRVRRPQGVTQPSPANAEKKRSTRKTRIDRLDDEAPSDAPPPSRPTLVPAGQSVPTVGGSSSQTHAAPAADKSTEPAAPGLPPPSTAPKVVSLDSFRKK